MSPSLNTFLPAVLESTKNAHVKTQNNETSSHTKSTINIHFTILRIFKGTQKSFLTYMQYQIWDAGSGRQLLRKIQRINLIRKYVYSTLEHKGVTPQIFRTGHLERELQMVHLSIVILWVSLVSFAAITLCVASQRGFIVVVYFVIDSVRKLLDTPSYTFPLLLSVDSGDLLWSRSFKCSIHFKLRWNIFLRIKRIQISEDISTNLSQQGLAKRRTNKM